MTNASQSQSNLPPLLNPQLGKGNGGRRSIELPLIRSLNEENSSGQIAEGAGGVASGVAAPHPPSSGGLPNHKDKNVSTNKEPVNLQSASFSQSLPILGDLGGYQPPSSSTDRPIQQTVKRSPKSKPRQKKSGSKPRLNFKSQLPQLPQFKPPQFNLPSVKLPSVKLPTVPLPPVPAFLKNKTKPWEWSIVWLWALGAFGGLGVVAFAWMASLPPLPECRTVTRSSPGNQRLYCAQEKARSGQLPDLLSAMALVNSWSEQEPLYDEVQRSISDWSTLILIAARDQMAQNDLKGAIETANRIPASSDVYQEAQETIDRWQDQWKKGEQAYSAAQAAMQAQNWSEAASWASTLNELQQDYWRVTQADRLAQQIQVEKQGWQALSKARKLAQSRSIPDIAGAIGLVKDIPPQTFVWQAAQADLQQWGQSLLDAAMRQWQQGDLDGAVATAQQVPLNVQLPSEVQDLVKFSHANQQIGQIGQTAAWGQIWNLMEGIAAMKQISPGSPLYEQAQAKEQAWSKQFTDGVQLQWATLGAQFGQQATLNWAIDQTKPLVGQSPVTDQAQQLIASWRGKLQILQDQPILDTAAAIAARNTIPDLQQAIVYLQQIPPDRATWSETQQLTAQWQQQIQILQDQPIWDEAQNLAKREQFDEAIAVASRIPANRALYQQAQQSIEAWKMTIRSREMAFDRQILDKAKAIAAKGDLTGAIATAAEIAPGRELYLEAQGAIGQWLRQRDGNSFSGGSDNPDELLQ